MAVSSRRWFATIIAFALVLCGLTSIGAQAAHATDEYDGLRAKWIDIITGGSSYTADSVINAKLASLASDAQSAWSSMDTNNATRTYLWPDTTGTNGSGSDEYTVAFNRLETMSIAYVAGAGSSLQGNSALLADIISGLDWLHTNVYQSNSNHPGNIFAWNFGIPLALLDTTILLYPYLTTAQITDYTTAVIDHQGLGVWTGANYSWETSNKALLGVILKDSATIAAARDRLNTTFTYVTSGEGFYSDGSWISKSVPYTGAYGISTIDTTSKIYQLLQGSTWAYTGANGANLFSWVYSSFEPLIYNGAMMDMVSGRAVTRYGYSDHGTGQYAMSVIARMTTFAPTEDATRLKSMLKYWIGADTYLNFLSNAPLPAVIVADQIVNDNNVVPRASLVEDKRYPSMDRVVHLGAGWGVGLAMSSNRVVNYDDSNQENMKGWYTGNGMLYLYNGDVSQYDDYYWQTANPYRRPGTTVDTRSLSANVGNAYLSPNNWVGGTDLVGLYSANGMDLDEYGTTLTAKKSWFMFDDEVVALGSGITSTDSRPIETIVENRKLNAAGTNAFVINGTAKSTSDFSESVASTSWANLAGNSAGNDIGYYFPGTATVQVDRETQSGKYSFVNAMNVFWKPGDPVVSNKFLSMRISQGTNPTNQTYSYVLLPGKTAAATATYAANPDVSILENTSTAQAVRESNLGIVAANVWSDGLKWIQVGDTNYVSVDKKSSVMVKETGNNIDSSVSDPTQANSGTIAVEINQPAASVISADPGITVTQLSPTIKYTASVSGAAGQSFHVKFSKVAPLSEGKTATASTELSSTYAASKANDTVTTGTSNGWSPLGTDTSPWWQVDLGARYQITDLKLFTRGGSVGAGQPETRRNFEVDASNYSDFHEYTPLGSVGSTSLDNGAVWTKSVSDQSTYQYVRVRKTASEYFFITEFQVFGNPQSNVALKKQSKASTELAATYSSQKANDGSTSIGWSPEGTTTDPQSWWQVDLGSPTKLTSVQLVTRQSTPSQAETRRNFEIVGSNDPNFAPANTTVLASQGGSSLSFMATFNATVSSTLPFQYIRVRKTANEYFYIEEFKAYN